MNLDFIYAVVTEVRFTIQISSRILAQARTPKRDFRPENPMDIG